MLTFCQYRPNLTNWTSLPKCLHRALLLSFSLLICGCQPPAVPNALQNVIDKEVLKVGTIYGRTTFYHGNTGPQGFEYELADGFADYLGVELQIYPYYSYHALMQGLQQGRIDIAAAGDTITALQANNYQAGPVYQQVSHKLVFQQGRERPRSPADLTEPLVVVKGSSNAQLLAALSDQYPDLNWRTTENQDIWELTADVAEGRLAYTLVDSNTLALQRRQYPQLSIGFSVDTLGNVAWLLNQNQDASLRAAVVEYFGYLHEAGLFPAMEDKYFGHVRHFNYVDTRAFITASKMVLPQFADLFKQFAGEQDWRLLAAISYQESHWQPDATSYTGVRGLMMLTQDTASDLNIASRLKPESSIRGGAEYLDSLIKRIPNRIKHPDRVWMALAAYNIGMGHLEDARVLTELQGGNPDLWVEVKRRLPLLEQKKFYKTTRFGFARGTEAKAYVENIRRYYDTLVYLDEKTGLLEAPVAETP